MSKPGIQRIVITDKLKGRGKWRFDESKKRWHLAEVIYRQVFDTVNPLLPGIEYLTMTQAEFNAGYDKFFGVDIILSHQSGMTSTLQEKILFTEYQTVTVEYMNNPHEEGDWFNLRVDYYFVGYDRTDEAGSIQEWILLDWRKVKEATGAGIIKWGERDNAKDGAMANFRWVNFNQIPANCRVASDYMPVKITQAEDGFYLSFAPDADFIADLKALPYHARKYHPDTRQWWVAELYFPCVADFVLAHYGIDLTPERNYPIAPSIIGFDINIWDKADIQQIEANNDKIKAKIEDWLKLLPTLEG